MKLLSTNKLQVLWSCLLFFTFCHLSKYQGFDFCKMLAFWFFCSSSREQLLFRAARFFLLLQICICFFTKTVLLTPHTESVKIFKPLNTSYPLGLCVYAVQVFPSWLTPELCILSSLLNWCWWVTSKSLLLTWVLRLPPLILERQSCGGLFNAAFITLNYDTYVFSY